MFLSILIKVGFEMKKKLETKIRRFREGHGIYISGEEWSKASIEGLLCGIVGCRNIPEGKCSVCKYYYCNVHKPLHERIH